MPGRCLVLGGRAAAAGDIAQHQEASPTAQEEKGRGRDRGEAVVEAATEPF